MKKSKLQFSTSSNDDEVKKSFQTPAIIKTKNNNLDKLVGLFYSSLFFIILPSCKRCATSAATGSLPNVATAITSSPLV